MQLTKLHSLLVSLLLPSVLCLNAQAAVVPAGVQLAEKQQLVRNNGGEVESLDPHKTSGLSESQVLNELLEGLVITNAKGQVIPGVAQRWQTTDNKTWIFHLNPQAKWSNGEPVTAEDFVYSWRRLTDPNTHSPYATYLVQAQLLNADKVLTGELAPEMLGVEAVNPQTLKVTLSEPLPYFIKMLFHTSVKPVNARAIAAHGDKWTAPGNYIGNGAYQLADWKVNEKIQLQRNPHYWDNAKTVIEQVTYLPIDSQITDVNRYRAGEIDITHYYLPIELFHKVKQESPEQVKQTPRLCTYAYQFNQTKAPFDNKEIRTALRLAFDQDILVNKVKNQGDSIAYRFVPPYIDGIGKSTAPDWAQLSQAERNQQAQALLTAAGYSKKNPLKFNLLYNNSDVHQKLAIAAASVWKKNSGGLVDVKLENQEWKTYLDTMRQGNYQVSRYAWCGDYNDPASFLNVLLSNSSNNYPKYKNPTYDKLAQEAIAASSDAQRAAMYQEMQQILDEDAVLVNVLHEMQSRFVKPYVGGYGTSNPVDEIYAKDLYIIKH